MKKLTFCILALNCLSFAMQPQEANAPFQPVILNSDVTLRHAVQNRNIISVLSFPDSEFTRIYTWAKNEYVCTYSGRILLNGASINPAEVKKTFSKFIAQCGLQDKSPEQILASCIKSNNFTK